MIPPYQPRPRPLDFERNGSLCAAKSASEGQSLTVHLENTQHTMTNFSAQSNDFYSSLEQRAGPTSHEIPVAMPPVSNGLTATAGPPLDSVFQTWPTHQGKHDPCP